MKKTMTLQFNNVNVEINNPDIQKKIWNFIQKVKEKPTNVPTRQNKPWTEAEDQILRDAFYSGEIKDVEKILERTDKAIHMRLYILGLAQPEKKMESIVL